MPHLFDPIKIKDVLFRNRVGVSPMCQYCYQNGLSNDWQVVHLGARASGGVGFVIAEATAVDPVGRISPYDAGIWTDEHIEPLMRVTDFIRSQGAVAGVQLAHAGRKACTNRAWDGGTPLAPDDENWWQAVGASPVSFNEPYQIPHELTKQEILDIQDKFKVAARRSYEAGFNFIEIHAAHGYLLHSFYSFRSNFRTDEYGGSFENRIRFLVETVQKVREVWPERLPLFVRISGTEWVDDGWNISDSIKLARVLEKNGVDVIDCSSGGNIPGIKIPLTPGYQVPISEEIRKNTGIKTATVGLITEAEHANRIVVEGKADFVLLGRELLRNPYWVLNAAQELGHSAQIPSQYLRAYK
ncbi:MAG TPA: NADH:flavin oxidoreductase/NADH oxidase [Anaerolineaceae bacterium]|nr:NADH:flavin oxidoreductase/NADH oxidase [Anaerolineaceae bacterium]